MVRGSNQTIWILDNNRIRVITLNVTFDIAFSNKNESHYTSSSTRYDARTRTGVPVSTMITKGSVSTLAGSTIQGGNDGMGKTSTFFEPSGLYVSSSDGIGYVSDTSSCHIRRVTPILSVAELISCDTVITTLIRPSGCTSYDQVSIFKRSKYFYLTFYLYYCFYYYYHCYYYYYYYYHYHCYYYFYYYSYYSHYCYFIIVNFLFLFRFFINLSFNLDYYYL